MDQQKLEDIIREGQHQTQEFRYAVSEPKSIARTLAAFANTDGGRLLIGVKSDGKIGGMDWEKEFNLFEEAVKTFCQPWIKYTTQKWEINDKIVLEVNIEPSKNKPHYAPAETDTKKPFVRVNRQNLLANHILVEVWKREKEGGRSMLKIKYTETKLLTYLEKFGHITFNKFCGMAEISPNKAEKILINLLYMKVIEMVISEDSVFYKINSKPARPEPNDDVILGDF